MKNKMENISLPIITAFVVLLLIPAKNNAQKTLQFNQVKLITSVETVPADRVWKVESVIGPRTTVSANIGYTSNPSVPAAHTIQINGTNVDVELSGWGSVAAGSSGNTFVPLFASSTITSLPIWLPQNAYIAIGSNVSYISVIEFIVVP